MGSPSNPLAPFLSEGTFLRANDLPEAARAVREAAGLSSAEAGHEVGVEPADVERAERRSYTGVNLRKQLVESLGGCTLDGPYYRIRESV
jgi:ribosome-binding protein aMBF1 (putative translation factor)